MATPCFLIEPTGDVRPAIIVFEEGDCVGPGRWHHRAEHLFPVEPAKPVARDDGSAFVTGNMPDVGDDTLPWPSQCDRCPAAFTAEAKRTATVHRQWRRADDPTVTFDRPHDAGPGAMWDADWMPSAQRSPDGRYLVAILPNGHEWHIDGRARNCTRPDEDHDCWCRHGEPPNVTVDKHPEPGRSSCSAGAGSIGSDGYHGFLRAGAFT